MEYLVQFFAWLMDWCHSWCPNWWADIVIFTFFTKVLQFPVSLWCQINSLKMVQLMPESNRIKMEHYGDSDAIGEQTAALFKREHYHPMLSLVPLAIQIAILMAFVKVIYGIGDKLSLPGVAKPLIACVPWTDGGLSWLMPLCAGAAAWLLGYSQNIFNPLQHEQTRAQQLTTNGISICISLFLGCFVAAGVGLYWAASNLMSILVQWAENICIPPAKYVDYPALRRSQAELKKFEDDIKKLSTVTPEDRRREKADYKRFFKVANKHLVFYSEGGGYWKYFQSTVEWLLEKTNVTIHYVTNDPKDGIFARAADNPRIRAYFIGKTRIIPLMMKMDADMVVMTTPDLGTYHIKRSYVKKDVEYVYIDHGPTSVHMCYRKGAFDNFDTIMCNGPFQVAEHLATEKHYALKPKRLVEAGYALLDTLKREDSPLAHEGVRIMVANSHQKDNIFDLCLENLVSSLGRTIENKALFSRLQGGLTIVLRPHPQYVRRNPARWQAIRERYINSALGSLGVAHGVKIEIEDDFSKPSTMDQSDVLVTDWSGIAYEFAYKTLRPTLFVNTPMKVINPEWEKLGIKPTDISFRDQVGVSVSPEALVDLKDGSPMQVANVVSKMLLEPAEFAERIKKLFDENFFNLGHAGETVGKYILGALIARRSRQ
jgi:YidC/Oxa1 family membrane protein insertase